MSDIPAEALQAAIDALLHIHCDHTLGWSCAGCRARVAVEAAAPFIAEHARREVAKQIRALSDWQFDGGYINLFAFLERHERLEGISVPILASALRALAGEIEESAREAFPKGNSHG